MDSPRILANRYRLEATIGHGGMGVVHRAIDQELERAVAIKLLSEDHDEVAFERFLTEAKRTAAVRHPCIIEVFDVGKDGPDAFLVMELLEGETLAQRLARGPIAAAEAVVIGGQICDALAAAHEAGLVHRDLKPANVFLVRTAESAPRVKLLDFGIAKRIDGATARTDPCMIVGTLEYLSPADPRRPARRSRGSLRARHDALPHAHRRAALRGRQRRIAHPPAPQRCAECPARTRPGSRDSACARRRGAEAPHEGTEQAAALCA